MWPRFLFAIFIIIVLFSSATSALVPDEINISSDTEWLVAGAGGTAVITVGISAPVNVAGISFYSPEGTFGEVTNAGKEYTTTFTETTEKSGVADILVDVAYLSDNVTEHAEKHYSQNIDHNTPCWISSINYECEVTAGSMTDIIVHMADEYGNPVDNRHDVESVIFNCSSDSAFENEQTGIIIPVDESGNATAVYRVSTRVGENTVYIDPVPENPEAQWITIEGVGDSVPAGISVSVQPNNANPPTSLYPFKTIGNGNYFVLTYVLTDRYGNPSLRCPVDISDDRTGLLGTYTPNQDGVIQVHYGPSEVTGVFSITATAHDNPLVNCTCTVEFYSSSPTDIIVSANPQVLASRDVNDNLTSVVRAKVIDEKGNPVRDVEVSFEITGYSVGDYVQTQEPELDNATSISDNDGYAIVGFHPGAFTARRGDPDYSETARGTATVQAHCTLSGVEKSGAIDVEYRNYPYLSVETFVEPETVEVNHTVDVTIRLKGDGWAFRPKPVDVVLCTDRSGSMLLNTTRKYDRDRSDPDWIQQESVDDRMVHAMGAAKDFVSQMNPSKDRVGLVSFGQKGANLNLNDYSYRYWLGNDYKWTEHWNWYYKYYWKWENDYSDDADYLNMHYHNYQTYSSYATRDINMTYDYTDVDNTIENWLPYGGTPMREGIYRSVRNIVENPRDSGEDPVRAIILLTDGEWNTGGSPQGESDAFSEGDLNSYASVITYAKDKNILIYTIALGNEASHNELRSYADETGGEFYSATAGDNLSAIYEDIAEKLQYIAGVNTTMDISFENIEVTNVTVPGRDVFSYEHIGGHSTRLNKFNKTVNPIPPYPYTIDQTDDWNNRKALNFSQADIGTINVGDVWEGTFSLNVSMAGNINIFGKDSVIRFNGTEGVSMLTLPDTFVTAVTDINATGIQFGQLNLSNLTKTSEDVDYLYLEWDVNYTGSDTLTQTCWYRNLDGKSGQVNFATRTKFGALSGYETAKIPLADLREGTYSIWVDGSAPDAGVARSNDCPYTSAAGDDTYYIKLE